MNHGNDRSLKVLLALLTLGVWGVLLRPFFVLESVHAQGQNSPVVGRYSFVIDSSAFVVFDTATGTYKRTTQDETYTGTWAKDYLNGTISPPELKK